VHLFPVDVAEIHPSFRNVTVHELLYQRPPSLDSSIRIKGLRWPFRRGITLGYLALDTISETYKRIDRVNRLASTIRRLKPDIIHSLEIQHAGYLTLDAKNLLGGKLPAWIVTNWGSDIYLFGRLSEHVDRIKDVPASCDYYSCECQRDVELAKQMGLRGEVLPVLTNTGGFDLRRVVQFRQSGLTSARRLILLKGYQHWAGRALVGLRSIALCARELQGYQVAVYLANTDVKIAAELVSKSTGIPIEVIPYCSHDDMLRLYGRARVSIGLSISDAISTNLLEAMVMGAFPIQSCTSCADEWIVDGQTGFIVPPEDPEPIAAAIRRAVSENSLVDSAAERNARLAWECLDQAKIKPQVIDIYKRIAAQSSKK
jgi:glycosyltransferase involved in cell wall biosynthesis